MSLQLEIKFNELAEDVAIWCEAHKIKYTMSFGPKKWTIALKKKQDLSRVKEAFSINGK